MIVLQVCFSIGMLLLPVVILMIRRLSNSVGQPNFTAVLGLLTVNISFFYLPWLDLSPIKGTVWRDLLDFMPDVVGQILAWRGVDVAAHGLETISQVVGLFELSGWETLLVTIPNAFLFFLVGLLAIAVYLLTLFLAWSVRKPAAGYALAVCSAVLLGMIIYFLPEIEELGERSFPSLLAIAVPLLRVEINWLGPLTMLAGLLLLIAGGLAHGQRSESDDEAVTSDFDDELSVWDSA